MIPAIYKDDHVVGIGDDVFSGASSLTRITIPSSVTSIGEGAFSGASSLTIYTEYEEKPEGRHDDWNPDDLDVIWGSLHYMVVF